MNPKGKPPQNGKQKGKIKGPRKMSKASTQIQSSQSEIPTKYKNNNIQI